jgi:hypothetical protein
MPTDVKDLAGLSQPIVKLIDVVSSAIGMQYRPRAVRAEAGARAYELKAIAKAKAEAATETLAIEHHSKLQRISELSLSNPELADRLRQRMLVREIEGQQNVEAILDNACRALPPTVSPEPVNPDWRRRFFFEAENICDVDLQVLWGKVLAGELTAPGSFAIRTIETMRNLSKTEAEVFRVACSLAMSVGWIATLGPDLLTCLKPFGLTYDDILVLRDAGLAQPGDRLHKDFTPARPIPASSRYAFLIHNNGIPIELSGPGLAHLKAPAIVFTQAARELQRLIEVSPNAAYLAALRTNLLESGVSATPGDPLPLGGPYPEDEVVSDG